MDSILNPADSSHRFDNNGRIILDFLNKYLLSVHESTEILEHFRFMSFSENGKIPIIGCNPREIIQYMRAMHDYTTTRIQSHDWPEIKRTYRYLSEGKVRTFEISNNMSLFHDIQFLCFMFFVLWNDKKGLFKIECCEPLMEFKSILACKYNLANVDITHFPINMDLITVSRIAYSYPSLTLRIFIKGPECLPIFPPILYSLPNLPRVFNTDIITLILPHSCDPPLAIMLALRVMQDDICYFGTTPLLNMFTEVCTDYECTVFPEVIKLELCQMQLNIIYFNKKKFKYEYFDHLATTHYYEAIDIISRSRRSDPHLGYILDNL